MYLCLKFYLSNLKANFGGFDALRRLNLISFVQQIRIWYMTISIEVWTIGHLGWPINGGCVSGRKCTVTTMCSRNDLTSPNSFVAAFLIH